MKKQFISIPVRSMSLDPQNKAQVRKLIEMADAKFRLSAKAWEIGNNSGDPVTLSVQEKRSRKLAREGCALLDPLGIKARASRTYPSFTVKGYPEHSTEQAVLAALGHPRNWLRTEEASK